MNEFKSRYLYIKQHSITGKLYFGKTTGTEKYLLKYKGSGKYWKDHLRIHGKEFVETLWYCLFNDKESIIEFCDLFCKNNNIGYGDLSIWANEKPENGIDGGSLPGHRRGHIGWNKGKKTGPQSDQHKANSSAAQKGIARGPQSEEHRRSNSISHKGQISWSKGKNQSKTTCPYCNTIGGKHLMKRYHFDNCKRRKQ